MSRPEITLIAAMARGRVIGRNNAMPWHLPADLAHFKRLTLDKPIIMGRRTWDSLPGLLPRRRHLVISADPDFRAALTQAEAASSPESALERVGSVPEVMIVGGASIYQAFLPLADRLLLTLIDAEIAGDTAFPAWSATEWQETKRQSRSRDAANPYDLEFVTLERAVALPQPGVK
ncbi:MAG: dihydrofolate reductase [Lamprobacter sp.]|uniref:dihydrofolate reductase n=1 Tax=Lamprobacter sp. TaxID=3100796 RepID=UPI002B25E311|nr:dihydrofolate reductase [Lamprobacter sp.]MEA3638437.1 dihydrofolate reductase [Lamprobacter sp.]